MKLPKHEEVASMGYRDLQKLAKYIEETQGVDINRGGSKDNLIADVLKYIPKEVPVKKREFGIPQPPPVKPVMAPKPKPKPPVVTKPLPQKPKKKTINKAKIQKEVLKRAESSHPTHIYNALAAVLKELGITEEEYNNA
jgi:outer membrane biosynthesis protein TonB